METNNTLSGPARVVFDKFQGGRDYVRPIPWFDYLTRRQRQTVYIIDRYDKYTEQLRQDIDLWMREMPLVSVDTESRIGEDAPFTAQVAFVHSLCVLIFRLDRLWLEGTRTSRRVVDLLPGHLLVHLHDARTSVLVSEAGGAHHFGPIRMVDIQHIFTLNRHRFSYADPTVSTRHGGKSGMAIISMVVNGYCHRPMKEDLAKDWFGFFGPHPGRLGWCGYDRWPGWRRDNGTLYRWRLHNNRHYWYMAHDVWVPLSFVLMLAQGDLCQRGNNHEGAEPVKLAWRSVVRVLKEATVSLGPDLDKDEGGNALDVLSEGSDGSTREELDVPTDEHMAAERIQVKDLGLNIPSGSNTLAEKPPHDPAVPIGDGLPVPGSSTTHSSRGLKRKREVESAMDEYAMVGNQPSKRARKKRGVKSTPLGLGVVATYLQPGLEHPEWGRRCGFCGSCGHLFFKSGDSSSCPHATRRMLADGVTMSLTTVCAYSKCTIGHLHVVRVCPVLHHICRRCGLRGHDGNCQMTRSWVRDALLSFEKVANQGLHTRKRFEEPEWGFFPRRRPAPSDVLPTYHQLLEMDPLDAYNFSLQECRERIVRKFLWYPKHGLHAPFKKNRPESYDLSVRMS